MRPNFHSVGGYDGMHLLYQALKKTGGDSDGDKLLAAMKGMAWTSVRGPVSIDAETRDMVQNVYIRKAEMVNGGMYNIEFDKVEHFKDPGRLIQAHWKCKGLQQMMLQAFFFKTDC